MLEGVLGLWGCWHKSLGQGWTWTPSSEAQVPQGLGERSGPGLCCSGLVTWGGTVGTGLL